jgi:hypothetical protein
VEDELTGEILIGRKEPDLSKQRISACSPRRRKKKKKEGSSIDADEMRRRSMK